MKRRNFFGILGASGLVAVTSGLAARHLGLSARSRARRNYRERHALTDAPTGALEDDTVALLLATTETLLAGTPIDTEHYEEFFRWRAGNLPGYNRLYETFQRTLDSAARVRYERSFSECDPEPRRCILDQEVGLDLCPRVELWARLRRRVLGDAAASFDRHVVPDILRLFARTEAMTALGYAAWIGTPRGLERYRQPPDEEPG